MEGRWASSMGLLLHTRSSYVDACLRKPLLIMYRVNERRYDHLQSGQNLLILKWEGSAM